MSVLIKGMEMPDDCSQCKLAQYDGINDIFCPLTDAECLSFNINRPSDCPLEEVPEHEYTMHGTTLISLKERWQMDSLISRQAAIEALNECRERTERSEEFAGLKIAVGVMRALPSAQPDTKAQLSGEGTTSDYISRQAAIDALNECRERTERSEEFAGLKIAVGVMRALPSAQPELYNNSTKLDSGNGECRATNKPKMGQYCIDHNCPWYDGKKCNSPNDPGYHECDYDRGIFPESYEENVKNSTESSLTQKPLDTIDRQAAIDALLAVTGNSSVRELYEHVQEHGLSDMWSGGVNAAIDVIIAQPSAQPELIYCKDCSYYDGRPCGIVDWYNTADDYCSRAERREDEQTD